MSEVDRPSVTPSRGQFVRCPMMDPPPSNCSTDTSRTTYTSRESAISYPIYIRLCGRPSGLRPRCAGIGGLTRGDAWWKSPIYLQWGFPGQGSPDVRGSPGPGRFHALRARFPEPDAPQGSFGSRAVEPPESTFDPSWFVTAMSASTTVASGVRSTSATTPLAVTVSSGNTRAWKRTV